MRVHKIDERRLKFRNRPAWVSSLVDETNGAVEGALFKWLDGQWACSPDQHYTDDYGYSFQKMCSYIMTDGTMGKERGEVEADPEKVEALQDLWVTYQKELGGPVFIP